MARSSRSARDAGTEFETLMARYFARIMGDDRIERRTRNGRKDRGDLNGLRTLAGGRVVAECKDAAGRYAGLLGSWLKEAELERGNDDAAVGLVLAKRRGTAQPGDQYVIMTAADLVALLTGERPE